MGMWGSVCGFLRLFCAFPLDRIQLSDFVISTEQYGRNPEDTIPRRKRLEWVSDDIYCFNSVFNQINSILIVWNPYRSVGIFIYLITQLNWSAFTKIYSRKHICEIYRWNENKLGGKTTKTETRCRQDRRQLELYSKMPDDCLKFWANGLYWLFELFHIPSLLSSEYLYVYIYANLCHFPSRILFVCSAFLWRYQMQLKPNN